MHSLSAQHCQPHCANLFCSPWSRSPRNPIETRLLSNVRNRQDPSNPGLQPSKPQPLSEPRNPSKPGTFKTTATFQTWGMQSSKTGKVPEPCSPGTCQNPPKPVEPVGIYQNLQPPHLATHQTWNRLPERVPGTARPEHTEIYIAQRPHSILLLRKKKQKAIIYRIETYCVDARGFHSIETTVESEGNTMDRFYRNLCVCMPVPNLETHSFSITTATPA